jgi:homoserine dehydrogenase
LSRKAVSRYNIFMTNAFKIGIAGLGTVGCGVVEMIQLQKSALLAKTGASIEITAVNARDPHKPRPVDLTEYEWMDDPLKLVQNKDIDCVVELIGGEEGPARDLIEAALDAGKHVITANKALLAHHGYDLGKLAEARNVCLYYEAAVAGGIPVIKALREGFAGNDIQGVYGILNGTCNYILSVMKDTGRDFEDVLQEAQAKGYAETPPDLDVDGYDAAHKLCLLSALAFGVRPDYKNMAISGIRDVSATDITFATELGYRIKLLSIARKSEQGLLQSVEACMVPETRPIARINDVFNAVEIIGDFVGESMLSGRGAGAGPTASAVLSDIIDLATGQRRPVFNAPMSELKEAEWLDPDEQISRFYVRLSVLDRPGVLADISAILRDHDISIESLLQRGRNPGASVPLVLITHEVQQRRIKEASHEIAALKATSDGPHILRIED